MWRHKHTLALLVFVRSVCVYMRTSDFVCVRSTSHFGFVRVGVFRLVCLCVHADTSEYIHSLRSCVYVCVLACVQLMIFMPTMIWVFQAIG